MDQPEWMPDCDLPEGSMPTACLVVVTYLNSEGNLAYAVATKGESPMTTYLGLTIVAQKELMNWGET